MVTFTDKIAKRIGTISIILAVLLVTVLFRSTMYTNYLTYVDSYKYLLNGMSFISADAKEYASEFSDEHGKFGYSFVLGLTNIVPQLKGDDFVRFVRYLNIVFSILIGIVFLLYLKKIKYLALFFFISPLYFSYSSYVISEYFALLVMMIAVFAFTKLQSQSHQKYYALLLGLTLGFIPFIRIELAVFTALYIAVLWFSKVEKRTIVTVITLLAYLIVTLIVSIHLRHGSQYLTNLFKLITGNFFLGIYALILAFYGYQKFLYKRYPGLPYYATMFIAVALIVLPYLSFTYKNAFMMDQILYAVVVFLLIIFSVYGIRQKHLLSIHSIALLISMISLITIYFVFDKRIDRYALTVFGLILIMLGTFSNEFSFSSIKKLTLSGPWSLYFAGITLLYTLFSFTFIYTYQPRPMDYQQELVKNIGNQEGTLYTSEYIALAYRYYYGVSPKILNKESVENLVKGDRFLIDDSIHATHSDINDGIMLRAEQYKIVDEIPLSVPFNYSAGYFTSGKPAILYEVR